LESAFWCVQADGHGGAHGLERIRPTGIEVKNRNRAEKKAQCPKS
jgi:hypothetical protein